MAEVKAFSVREKILSFQRAITPKELEEITGISQSTLCRHAKNGMPHMRIGGSVIYDPRELLAWIDSQSPFNGNLR
jgi:predicted DNA-binding transcriptional regulator AlpA